MGRTNQGKKIEVLAPAGNREAFYGAVHAGADAIYMGGEKFGARAYADNFSGEELVTCIRYGHIHGCRSYLTVNTLMKEQELAELVKELKPLYEAGLDGVIVQDIGALRVIRHHFPQLELHASTQMTVTGPAGANLLKELGVSRVVPARELDLKELGQLKKESGLKVEAFVHGAMCYCYSGACLFSSLLGGRSGNRGRCAQPCRLAYETDSPGASIHRREYYPLSLKDMCTIEHLPELIEAGIDSLKIEGRMKKPEYAAGVTAIYRKYTDRYLTYPEGQFHVEKQDMDALSKLYIRSQKQDGYYFRHNGREMVTLNSPSYSGSDEACLEQVRQRYIEQKRRLEIWMKAEFVCDQPVHIQVGTKECQTEVWGGVLEPAQNRPILEADIRKQLQKLGETCFALKSLEIHTDERGFYSLKEINALRREAVRQLEDQLIISHGLVVCRQAGPASLPTDDLSAGSVPEENIAGESVPAGGVSTGRPLIDSRISEEPPTTRGTIAEVQSGGIATKETQDRSIANNREGGMPCAKSLRIHISTEEQLLYLANNIVAVQESEQEHHKRQNIDRLYVESHLFSENQTGWRTDGGQKPGQNQGRKKVLQALDELRSAGISLWTALPYILRRKDWGIMEQAMDLYRQGKIQGFLVRNLEEYGWLWQKSDTPLDIVRESALNKETTSAAQMELQRREHPLPQIQLDHTVYVWNSQTAAFWLKKGCGLTCPLELNGKEWEQLLRRIQCSEEQSQQAGKDDVPEKLVYGRIPMMVTANCIARTAGKCLHGQVSRAEGALTDRYKARFPVEIRCDVCMNVIYNSVPLSLHKEQENYESKRLSFTVESGREMGQILNFFADCANGKPGVPPYKDYTTGHEKRGVL